MHVPFTGMALTESSPNVGQRTLNSRAANVYNYEYELQKTREESQEEVLAMDRRKRH